MLTPMAANTMANSWSSASPSWSWQAQAPAFIYLAEQLRIPFFLSYDLADNAAGIPALPYEGGMQGSRGKKQGKAAAATCWRSIQMSP